MRPWTCEEEIFLDQAVNVHRMTATQIARSLKRTKGSIIGKVHKSGMAWNRSPTEISWLNRLAARIGRRHERVQKICRRLPTYVGQH